MHSRRSLIELWCIVEQFVAYMQIASTVWCSRFSEELLQVSCNFHLLQNCTVSTLSQFTCCLFRGSRHPPLRNPDMSNHGAQAVPAYRISNPPFRPSSQFLLMVPRRFPTKVFEIYSRRHHERIGIVPLVFLRANAKKSSSCTKTSPSSTQANNSHHET